MTDNKIPGWVQWVALTTTILAVSAALSTLKGGAYSTKTQIMTTQENDKWSHYQAKSIKQNLYELQEDQMEMAVLQATDPQVKKKAESNLESYRKKIKTYNKEKEDIKKVAENLSSQEQEFKLHSSNFGIATMLLQIAIMLSSISALLKKKMAWYMGLVLGAAGILYLLNGFLLLF